MSTLGYADNSDVGLTAGNGFISQWPDDLAALHEVGITDVRLTLDWARLQPRPTDLDGDWAERYEHMLAAADVIGLRVWATLHDGSIPRWLDNDGGFDDDETFATWWPRWVERIAERFGDSVAGWVPFAEIPRGAPAQPWRDTWSILEGTSPVVASVSAETTSIEKYVGCASYLGISLPTPWEHDEAIGDRQLETASTQWGQAVRDGADDFDGPVVITGFCPDHDDLDAAALIVDQLVTSLDDATADGVKVDVCFLEPAISLPDSPPGLLDPDRNPTPAAKPFRHTVPGQT
ncbi:MAG TPA: family 1 glycosylhydrolase [Ilumatobacteraceae bacterium]|nr:family 1 glycosylhydrolase [Ilumatobacteraceae bacterium]